VAIRNSYVGIVVESVQCVIVKYCVTAGLYGIFPRSDIGKKFLLWNCRMQSASIFVLDYQPIHDYHSK
jgi:hypothetical protein